MPVRKQAANRIRSKWATISFLNGFAVEQGNNVFLHHPICILLEDFSNHSGSRLINHEVKILIFLITIGTLDTKNATFGNRFPLSSSYLLSKLSRVVFCHALKHGFQNDTFRTGRDILKSIANRHPAFPETVFIQGDFFSVTTEAVYLPSDNGGELLAFCITEHLLEFITMNRVFTGQMPISIDFYDTDVIPAGIFFTIVNLSFNTLVGLIRTRRISRINNTVNKFFFHSLYLQKSAKKERSNN